MNKKSILLAMMTATSAAVVGTIVLASGESYDAAALNRDPQVSYTITMNGNNCSKINGNLLRCTNDNANASFDFYKTGDSRVVYGTFPYYGGGNDAFLSFQGNDSYSYLNNLSTHGILGITSINVDYCRQTNYVDSPNATSAGEDGDLKVLYGYLDSEGALQYETTAHDLPCNADYDLSDLSPRYFKITGSKAFKDQYTNGRINIKSITITYSCDKTRSDIFIFYP